MANLPKPTSLTPGQRHLRMLAQRMAERPQQPNLGGMGRAGAGDKSSILDWRTEATDRLAEWARIYAPEHGSGYRVSLDVAGRPTQAAMSESTLDKLLAHSAYGDAYPAVRKSMLDAPEHASLHYPGAASLQQYLENPFYVFMDTGSSRSRGVGAFGGNSIYINPARASELGISARRVGGHELGHALSPIASYGPHNRPMVTRGQILDELAKRYPALAADSDALARYAERLEYMSDPNEMAANLNQLRRLNFGLTGDPLVTPEGRIRFLQGLETAPLRDIGKPSMVPDTMFPGDPVMRHGPAAGKPADGGYFLEQSMNFLLPRLQNKAKRSLESIFNKSASAAPVEAGYV